MSFFIAGGEKVLLSPVRTFLCFPGPIAFSRSFDYFRRHPPVFIVVLHSQSSIANRPLPLRLRLCRKRAIQFFKCLIGQFALMPRLAGSCPQYRLGRSQTGRHLSIVNIHPAFPPFYVLLHSFALACLPHSLRCPDQCIDPRSGSG